MEWTQVAIILYYKHRRNALNHDTIAKLAEKGLPVPPELLAPQRTRSSLRGGLVLLGLGLALSFYAWERGMPWSVGLIPGFMGIALLIAWRLEERPAQPRDPPTR